MSSALRHELEGEPDWPLANGRRVVFLIDATSGFEARLLAGWIARRRPQGTRAEDCEAIRIPPTRRHRRVSLARLEACLAAGDDPLLAPLRVAWFPKERGGRRSAVLSDLLRLRDPHDPGLLRQRLWLMRAPDRCRIVAGEPAPASELRERWRQGAGSDVELTTGLAEFVARQAALALERAERRLRGARYKVPRLLHDDILGRPGFRGGLAKLARELGRTPESVTREASRDLREIAATHSPFVIDLVAHGIHLLYTRGYGEALHYDRAELERIKALAQQHPVVFLPSHKSNLDHLVLQYALHENGHPPNHTAGGINMNFLPVGPLVRRSGVFFIRRSFKDDAIYKFVLQHYIDYLVEKRFTLEWYVEGGRSRTGKLLPPRFGMLAYVVDSYRRGKAEDVILVPVSIAYDQIQDVGEYAAEQGGAPKERESFSWFVRMIRRLGRRYGGIHIRFGEPLSLAKAIGRASPALEPDPDEQNLALRKLAFEVCVRINRATPITPCSLVTLAMIGSGFRALSVDETVDALRNLLHFVRSRGLPTTEELRLDDPEEVRRQLDALVENGVASCFRDGPEPVYRIGPEQQLAAAYYRNTVIHFFVTAAVAELALLRAAEDDGADPLAAFWEETLSLRDLLKFEFFFADKETFRGEIAHELRDVDPAWEAHVRAGSDEIRALLRRFRPFSSHRVLRPFVEAYGIVADLLVRQAPGEPLEETRFVQQCLGLGRQYHLQRRIHSAASLSQPIFRSALQLARNRGLLDPGGAEVAARRREFAEEVRAAVRRVEAVDALAASRRAGLIP
jgi:glycerol-3-phosphate O-acyltransferase